MFIIRFAWIVVFLVLTLIFTGFQMVECKPVHRLLTSPSQSNLHPNSFPPSSSTHAPSTTTTQFLSTTTSTIDDTEDYDEEENSVDIDGESEELEPVITRTYALYSACSGRSLQLIGKRLNHVRAEGSPNSPYAQLTVRSVRPGEISISNEMSQRFLCFNRQGKLIMRMEFQDHLCVFHERVQESYVVIQSAYNKTWFVGFGREGRSLHGAAWRKKLPKNRGCYNFMKTGETVYQSMGDISHHHQRGSEHRNRINRIIKKHGLIDAVTTRSTSRTPATRLSSMSD